MKNLRLWNKVQLFSWVFGAILLILDFFDTFGFYIFMILTSIILSSMIISGVMIYVLKKKKVK